MKKRSNVRIAARMLGLVRPLAGYMALAIALGVAGFCCANFLTVVACEGLLTAAGRSHWLPLGAIFALMLAMAVLRGCLHYGEQTCNHYIAFKLLAHIRDLVFGALRRLCPAKLEGRDKGDLISVLTSDIELLEVFYAHTISPICIAFFMTIIMVAFIGQFHPALGLLALAAYLTIGILVPVAVSRLSGDSGLRFRTEAGELSTTVLDSLRGVQETLQYGGGAARLERMNAQTDSLSRTEEHLKAQGGTGTAVTGGLILCFSLASLALGVSLYRQGAVSLNGVLLATVAQFSSFGPVVALANLGSTLQSTFAAGNRVLDILEEKPLVEERATGAEPGFTGGSVERVSFSYGQEQILTDLSLEIPKGRVLGIMGRSGSGKSTLLKLLMRFWDVQQGAVKLSGVPVGEIRTGALRDMEGFVTQDTVLFHDSIRDNLLLAKPNATQQELEAACRQAAVHDFITSLPKGYDTMVGELGSTLSGGERQRLGLARAFLHDAPLLLLDEPTSSLDSLSEAAILKSLDEQRQRRTIVLVSHRPSTMSIADAVCRVENGRRS